MQKSIWMETVQLPRRDSLKGELAVEAAVIGGGLAGMLTAWRLRERGVRAVVLEANRVGSGQSGHTTAKITAQHGLIYHRLLAQLGEEGARRYAWANFGAVEEYRRLAEELEVDCDWVSCPAWLYSTAGRQALEREAKACQRLGLPVQLVEQTGLPFPVAGAVRMEHQAVFHPLKLLAALSQRLEVFEQTPVLGVTGQTLHTPQGRVRAEHIVFACHYPFPRCFGLYFARMYQERSYVLALEGAGKLDGPYFEVAPAGLSLRPWGDFILLGGGGHRTGENSFGGRFAQLEGQAARLWPDSRVAARWSAQDCVTLDGLPYLGRFSPTRPRWYVATGFAKWGMTTAMAAADLLSAQICGEEHPLEKVCSPRRFSWTAAAGLARQSGKSLQGLARSAFYRPARTLEQLRPGQGGIVSHRGKKRAAYREEDGTVHMISPYCPHLGCQLDWNPDTLTWDCPCHGSRFDVDGHLIDDPAKRDAGE